MDKKVGPIGIGIGDSVDEQTLIVEVMNETQVCGNLQNNDGLVLFEKCPGWFLRSYPGNHDWKNNPSNAVHIASIIDEVLLRVKQPVMSCDVDK